MATDDVNLAERSGSLVETHRGSDPRLIFFHFAVGALLLILVAGLAWQQLFKNPAYHSAERVQNQRRILIPGPRGNIYARDGTTVLVGNRPRFAVLLHLDELKSELLREHVSIHRNFLATGDRKELPTYDQLQRLARVAVVQRYLDELNVILHRDEKVDARALQRHFDRQLLLPYPLLTDLAPDEFARLIERLPVRSPLDPTTTITRDYPFGSAAAHTLGYVGATDEVAADDFPGEGLKTFKLKGSVGENGLEQSFDSLLQGEAGGMIYRVDPTGYKVNPPLEQRLPVQGKNFVASIDIDLQLAAEETLGDQTGSCVALDVATGEVLAIASKPDYDLSKFRSKDAIADIEARHAWTNLALNGLYPPGSTFKILTSIAALRRSAVKVDEPIVDCEGTLRMFNRAFVCYNGHGIHGHVLLPEAIAKSCDIFFYEAGWRTTADQVAAEARRFRLDQRTGIELPHERGDMLIPDSAWKEKTQHEKWFPGDTANMAIGQGAVRVSPLQMACFVASVARGEVFTQPTLVHRADRAAQRTESIGLTLEQRRALLEGMVGCTTVGTAKTLTTVEDYRVPGVRIAGKTGTAQIPGKKNVAWFICFAPAENPEIAMAIAVEGDTPGEEFGGGLHAAPVASAVLKKYFEKKQRGASPFRSP